MTESKFNFGLTIKDIDFLNDELGQIVERVKRRTENRRLKNELEENNPDNFEAIAILNEKINTDTPINDNVAKEFLEKLVINKIKGKE